MDVEKYFVAPDIPIRDAIRQLDETAKKILLVVKDDKLAGVITDGDIRRWILQNKDLSMPVHHIMNPSPIVIKEGELSEAFDIMKEKKIEGLPVINDSGQVLKLVFWNELQPDKKQSLRKKKTPVVIMAGGKGSRLYPYTKIIPKPLIPIGDTPIVERIMNQMI
ncbi:MAG: Nucleotidyl transferase, partial [Lacrimispora sp.]|nr:Nucleotidyl transferase [Lacrimispora sp.]